MVTLISSILVALGIANWFCIGALQYDFVAGLFGSQANIFSRIVYVVIGIAGVILVYSIIRNKGKIAFKNKDKPLFNFHKKQKANAEVANDTSINNQNIEAFSDTSQSNSFQNRNMSSANQNIEASSDQSMIEDEIQTQRNQNDINESRRKANPNSKTFFSTKQDTEAAHETFLDTNNSIQSRANRLNNKNQLSEKNYNNKNHN